MTLKIKIPTIELLIKKYIKNLMYLHYRLETDVIMITRRIVHSTVIDRVIVRTLE